MLPSEAAETKCIKNFAFNKSVFTFERIKGFALSQDRQRFSIIELVITVNILKVFSESSEGQMRVADPRLWTVGRPAEHIVNNVLLHEKTSR